MEKFTDTWGAKQVRWATPEEIAAAQADGGHVLTACKCGHPGPSPAGQARTVAGAPANKLEPWRVQALAGSNRDRWPCRQLEPQLVARAGFLREA